MIKKIKKPTEMTATQGHTPSWVCTSGMDHCHSDVWNVVSVLPPLLNDYYLAINE